MAKKKEQYHGSRPCIVVDELRTPKPLVIEYTDEHGGRCRVYGHELTEEPIDDDE